MNLKEAIDFVDIGYKKVLLTDKNNEEYFYNYLYQFKESEDYEKLLPLEVANIDIDNDTVIFYLR